MERASDGEVTLMLTRAEMRTDAPSVNTPGDETVQAEAADNKALESGADLDEWLADEAGYGYGV